MVTLIPSATAAGANVFQLPHWYAVGSVFHTVMVGSFTNAKPQRSGVAACAGADGRRRAAVTMAVATASSLLCISAPIEVGRC